MTIPTELGEWRKAMLWRCETRRMIRRIEGDTCLHDDVPAAFFTALTNRINTAPLPTGTSGNERAAWGKDCALAALVDTVSMVCARGPEIPAGSFDNLARVRPARVYHYCLPTTMRVQFFREFNITAGAWKSAMDDQLRLWIEGHQTVYVGPIETGGKSGPAFVADDAQMPAPLPSFNELQDLLGLVFENGDRTLGLVFRYPRTAVEGQGLSLCLPRSFDGLDYELFAMEKDCAAPHGRTRRPNGQPGLPEAVHPGCQIPGPPVMRLEVIA